jgi:hypothetical protein
MRLRYKSFAGKWGFSDEIFVLFDLRIDLFGACASSRGGLDFSV